MPLSTAITLPSRQVAGSKGSSGRRAERNRLNREVALEYSVSALGLTTEATTHPEKPAHV